MKGTDILSDLISEKFFIFFFVGWFLSLCKGNAIISFLSFAKKVIGRYRLGNSHSKGTLTQSIFSWEVHFGFWTFSSEKKKNIWRWLRSGNKNPVILLYWSNLRILSIDSMPIAYSNESKSFFRSETSIPVLLKMKRRYFTENV